MSDYPRSTVSTINGVNAETQKIQTAVNSKMDKSGGAFTGTVDMNEQRLINLPDATDPSEAMPLGQGLVIQEAAETAAARAEDEAVRAEQAADSAAASAQLAMQYPEGVLAVALAGGTANVGGVEASDLSYSVATVADLLSAPQLSEKAVNVREYRTGLGDGGGVFYWEPTKPKSAHDGWLVIDPLKPFPADFTNTSQRDSWFAPSVSGTGCWVKQTSGAMSVADRGYVVDQPTNYAEDLSRISFGQEYLQYAINAARNSRSTPLKWIHSGDSTTENGYGEADSAYGSYPPSMLMTWLSEAYGVRAIHVNAGHSGESTVTWDSTYVEADLAAHPDMHLYQIRWGINDGSQHGNVQTFETALRSGLAKLRAAKGNNLSILLTMPNSTFDSPNGRDFTWYEKITPIMCQAARDYKACFFNAYAYLRDSKNGADLWMDNPFSDGRTVHGFAEFNASIYAEIARMVLGPVVALRKNLNRVAQVSGSDLLLSTAVSVEAFPYGFTTYRTTGDGFPLNGFVEVTKTPDNIVYQRNVSYATGDVQSRTYDPIALTWSAFKQETPVLAVPEITASAGYTSFARIVKQGAATFADGYIEKTSASALTAGTIIGTVPVSYRPTNDSVFFNAAVWDGATSYTTHLFKVNPGGEISNVNAIGTSVKRVWTNIPSWGS